MSDFSRDSSTVKCSFPNKAAEVVKNYSLGDSYRVVSWVYACINAIAEAISGVPLKFYTTDDPQTRAELPEEHQVMQLFNPPKAGETPTLEDYIRQIYVNLGIFGEIFSPLEFEGARPMNIPVRSPFLFEVQLDNNGDVKLWKMEKYSAQGGTSGEKKNIAPEKLLHFKYYDPYNRHRGLSPLYAGRLPIQQDINMSVWNAGFFQGGLRNPIVILLKHMLGSGPVRQNYLQGLKNQFQGFVKGQGPLVVDGGADVRPLLSSIKDLDFIEGKSLTREEICALYGVPPAQVGIFRYANYANSREQTRLFWINTLIPKMRVLKNTLQTGLLDLYWPGTYCDWDWDSVEAIREDPITESTAESLQSQAARNYYDMGYTREQIALILDDPDLDVEETEPPEGEEPPPTPEEPTNEPTPEEPVEESIIETRHEDGRTELAPSKRTLQFYAREYQTQILAPYRRQYTAFLKTFSNQAITEVLDGKEMDHAKWQRRWIETIRPLMRTIYYDGARQAVREIAKRPGVKSFRNTQPFNVDQILEGQDVAKSIDFFVRATSAKSYAITGAIEGYTRSPAVNILSENPEAVILPMISEEEANWAISRIYHHGRMVAQDITKVDRHAWAAYKCPIPEHNDMTGMTVARWASFHRDVIHPNADISSAPVKACTCTTFPVEFVKAAKEDNE